MHRRTSVSAPLSAFARTRAENWLSHSGQMSEAVMIDWWDVHCLREGGRALSQFSRIDRPVGCTRCECNIQKHCVRLMQFAVRLFSLNSPTLRHSLTCCTDSELEFSITEYNNWMATRWDVKRNYKPAIIAFARHNHFVQCEQVTRPGKQKAYEQNITIPSEWQWLKMATLSPQHTHILLCSGIFHFCIVSFASLFCMRLCVCVCANWNVCWVYKRVVIRFRCFLIIHLFILSLSLGLSSTDRMKWRKK